MAAQGGGQAITVMESVTRNNPHDALTVAEMRYLPGLLKKCRGLVSADVLVFPLAGSPKFQAMALMSKSVFKRNRVPLARQVSVERMVPVQGLRQGTITFENVLKKVPQFDVMVALIV